MRTTISLPETLLNSAKRQAKSRGVTLSEVVADALRTQADPAPANPPPFKLHTVRGKLVEDAAHAAVATEYGANG